MGKRGGSSYKKKNMIEITGVSELLNKIEAAGGRVDDAVNEMVEKSLEVIGNNANQFMEGHKLTGDTLKSYQLQTKVKDGNIKGSVGYSIKKGGLPAIFLDIGTPTQKGYFWRYYAIENTRPEVKAIQQEALKKILGDLTDE